MGTCICGKGVRDEHQDILGLYLWEFPRYKLLRYCSWGQENLTADTVGNDSLFVFFFVAISSQYQWVILFCFIHPHVVALLFVYRHFFVDDRDETYFS